MIFMKCWWYNDTFNSDACQSLTASTIQISFKACNFIACLIWFYWYENIRQKYKLLCSFYEDINCLGLQ